MPTLIFLYIFIGILLLYRPFLRKFITYQYNAIVLEPIQKGNPINKLVGVTGFLGFGAIILFAVGFYPLFFVRSISKGINNVKTGRKTRRKRRKNLLKKINIIIKAIPEKDYVLQKKYTLQSKEIREDGTFIVEERDYDNWGLILVDSRQLKYDNEQRLTRKDYFNKKGILSSSHHFFYNKFGQLYANHVTQFIDGVEVPLEKNYFVSDIFGRTIVHFQQESNGMCYEIQIFHNENGNQNNENKILLSNRYDLESSYQIAQEQYYMWVN